MRETIAEAMASLDSERIAEALSAVIHAALSPAMFVGFTIDESDVVDIRTLDVDPDWDHEDIAFDFAWVEPALGYEAANGTSMIGPPLRGLSQIAAMMDVGDGRYAYFVIAGEYDDPERARSRLASIATEAGLSARAMTLANERASDLAASRERERLSRDLHDSLSQSLWSLSMLSETAQSMTNPGDPLHPVIQQITEISLTSQEEMRSLLINLRSAQPSSETIAGVLESLVADFRAANDVQVVASIAEADLDAGSIMALRRIAEEALNNIGRHAEPSTVAVLFDAVPVMSLRIADDGKGFDPKPMKGHLGLRIMKERADEIGFEFELASAPGHGTVVTAAAELARARPRPWARPKPEAPSRRRAALLLLCGLLSVAMAAGSLVFSWSSSTEAQQAQSDLDVLTVLEERVRIGEASAREATARVLEGVGEATMADVVLATTERSVAIADAREIIGPLADAETLAGQYALQFLDSLDGSAVFVPGDQRLDQLYSEVDSMEGPGAQPALEATTPTHSLGNLAALDRTVTFGVLESVVARYAMDPDSFSPSGSVQSFFEGYVDVVRHQGGFYGPDASMPFRNGVIPTSVAMVHEREAVEALSRITVEAQLWPEDQWLRQWSEASVDPPTSLAIHIDRAERASAQGGALIGSRFDARRSEITDARNADRYRSQLFGLAAGLLALAALVAFILSFAASRGRRKAMAADRLIDPLTGLGNRTALEHGVEAMLRGPAFDHHLVVMLDMDRLRFVSDVHGRAFGDRLLETVALGLENLAVVAPNAEGMAVRLGDDEFLLSLHSTEAIDPDLPQRAMNRLRATLVSAPDGSLVRCGFSYGVVHAKGSPALSPLLAACELAMYEDKARLDSSQLNS